MCLFVCVAESSGVSGAGECAVSTTYHVYKLSQVRSSFFVSVCLCGRKCRRQWRGTVCSTDSVCLFVCVAESPGVSGAGQCSVPTVPTTYHVYKLNQVRSSVLCLFVCVAESACVSGAGQCSVPTVSTTYVYKLNQVRSSGGFFNPCP